MILRFVGNCLQRLLTLAVLVGGVALALHYHDAIADRLRTIRATWLSGATQPSPEVADAAERKLQAFADGRPPDRLALSEVEVQSLVRYRVAPLLPRYLTSPSVDLRDGRVRLGARVPTARIPTVGELGEMAGFLPDTADVVATGLIIPVDESRAALQVNAITAARVPLPDRMIPDVLTALGREDEPRVPANAVAVALPAGVRAVYVGGDSLVFLGRTRSASAK